MTSSRNGQDKKSQLRFRINEQIRSHRVRLVLSKENEEAPTGQSDSRIVSTEQALDQAQRLGLDLVEVSPNMEPPVVRIMDYKRYLYESSKKLKKKSTNVKLKEIKFRPVTDEGDYQVKLRNLLGFLNQGNKAKVTIRFRGREITHHELGMKLLKRLISDMGDSGTVDQMPKMEGRQMVMMISPGKRTKS